MDTRKASMNPDAPPFLPGSKDVPGGDDKDAKKKSVNQEISDTDDEDLSDSNGDTVEIAGYRLPKDLEVDLYKEKTFYLEGKFPGYSTESLARLLAFCDGNLDEAINLLESYGPDKKASKNSPGTSQTDVNSRRGSSSS